MLSVFKIIYFLFLISFSFRKWRKEKVERWRRRKDWRSDRSICSKRNCIKRGTNPWTIYHWRFDMFNWYYNLKDKIQDFPMVVPFYLKNFKNWYKADYIFISFYTFSLCFRRTCYKTPNFITERGKSSFYMVLRIFTAGRLLFPRWIDWLHHWTYCTVHEFRSTTTVV